MPTHKYALESGGPKRLEITYSFGIRNVSIWLDREPVGRIESRKALNEGRDFDLPDGTTLTLQLVRNGLASQLRVLRDGIPVPGSATDPVLLVKNAYSVLFVIAAFNIAVGLGIMLFHLDALKSLGTGWFTVGFGIVFLILGFAVRAGSQPALIAAVVIFLIDSGLALGAVITKQYQLSAGSVLVRGFLLATLVQALGAIGRLDDEEKPKRGQPQKQKAQPRTWTTLEKGLITIVGVLMLAVGGLLFMFTLPVRTNKATPALPTLAVLSNTENQPPIPTIVYPSDYPVLMLKLKAQAPQPTINLPAAPSDKPLFPGDLAWNQPTFANKFYEQGYPSSTTSGGSGWRTASSNGSWLYVDLGQPQTIHQLVVNHFVDANATNKPQSYYIVSDDLVSWQVVVDEINTANSYMRFKPRIITLANDVTARYVGIFAKNWNGGWGGVQSFSAIAPGYDYTYETLPKI